MIEAQYYTQAGGKRDSAFALPEEFFDGSVNEPVLHQAVKVYLNNQRQGTAKTKTRSFVSGGNQKPWKQKGTGRARQGSTRAPHWRGGGIVFGPIPRDYRTDIPRKVKQLARKSALNARAREGALHVVERFAFRRPKTAQLAGLLASLGLDGRKVLLLTAGANEAVYLSGRNLPTVDVMPYAEAAAYDVLWAEAVVVEEGALTGVMPEPLPDEPEEPATPKTPKRSAVKAVKTAKTAKTAKRTEAKAAKKSATKAKAVKKSTAKAAKKAAGKPAKKAAPKAKPKKKGEK
ncbi:MAG: 50S ribosomal protein L4 [Gemmatimonadales bacterium]